MKNQSLVHKLWFLSAQLLLNILAIGFLANWITGTLSSKTLKIAEHDLPIVRNMALIDMMHDGIMGTVYRAFYEQRLGQSLDSAVAELDEMKANIVKYYEEIGKEVGADLQADYHSVNAPINAYKESAISVVQLLAKGDVASATAAIPDFQQKFDQLEDTLESLGSKLEQAVAADLADAKETITFADRVNFWLQLVSLIGGFLASFLVIRSMTKSMRSITENLASDAAALTSSANEINKSSQILSEAATEQSAAIEETASSMEEMSAMIKQTSTNAQDTQQAAETARRKANDGKNSVEELVVAMGEISKTTNELSALVKVINDIESKTKVINDIAFETKLLAFNASIEAARAGAHGRGFAVVADEVGKLAATSSKAADEVRTLLETSQSQVAVIVDDTRSKIEAGKARTDACAASFAAMESSLVMIADSVNSIANAAKEQTAGVSQTNAAMQEMEKATRVNATSADSLARSATTLLQRSGAVDAATTRLKQVVLGSKDGTGEKSESNADIEPPTSSGSSFQGPSTREVPKKKLFSVSKASSPNVQQSSDDPNQVSRDDSRWRAA